jgi:predicted nicotinamide N-methyase
VFLFAHHVWKASVLLSKMIINEQYNIQVSDKTCLELGAGAGLVSLVTMLKGGNVVASDYPSPHILSALEANFKRNVPNTIGKL